MNTLTSREQSHHRGSYVPVEYDRVCKYCGKQFIAHDMRKVYCSERCCNNASNVRRGIAPTVDVERHCMFCGSVFVTPNQRKVFCSKSCRDRARNKRTSTRSWEQWTRELAHKSEERKEKRKSERLKYIKDHTEKRICIVCGEEFECIDTSKQKTCSTECSKRRARMRADKRIPKDQIIDKDINLDALIKRDNNRCYICGCECDKTDIRTSKKGNPYPGKKYPTIEHLIPICRGGKHAWDNVRLACWECNHKKGTDISDVVKLDKEIAYQYKTKRTIKKVVQMTKAGAVVRTWDSVRKATEKTKWNEKRIREACRGKHKSAYGFIWKYAE